jgi:hypothetical protein
VIADFPERMDQIQVPQLIVDMNLSIVFSGERTRAFNQNRFVFAANDRAPMLADERTPYAVHQDHSVDLHQSAFVPIPRLGVTSRPTATRSASLYANSLHDWLHGGKPF